MKIYDFKKYIFDSCKFLGINVSETANRTYILKVPELLEEVFGRSRIEIDFKKPDDSDIVYLTPESYLAQKLAQLVADKNIGVSSVLQEFTLDASLERLKSIFDGCEIELIGENIDYDNTICLWCKTKVTGEIVEEYLKGYQFNEKNMDLRVVSDNFTEFLEGKDYPPIPEVSPELIEKFSTIILERAKNDALSFVQEKQKHLNEILEKETKRINDYYNLLIRENTQEASTELLLLKNERENLIRQQKDKFTYKADDIFVEPVALLVIQKKYHKGSVRVKSRYGEVIIPIHGNERVKVKCSFTGSEEGPFTVTAEGKILVKN